MTVEIKSHIIRRDEKGFFGIPFKRLLLAGMVGGGTVMFTQNLFGSGFGIGFAVVVTISTLIMTASRGGVPAWKRLRYSLAARLLLAANQDTALRQITDLLNISPNQINLDSTHLFGSQHSPTLTRPEEWVVYTDLDKHGLTLVDSPTGAGK